MLNNCIKGSNCGKFKNLISKPKIIAIPKFVNGPEIETLRVPHFWSLKLYGFIGTGFAHAPLLLLIEAGEVLPSQTGLGVLADLKSVCLRILRLGRPTRKQHSREPIRG